MYILSRDMTSLRDQALYLLTTSLDLEIFEPKLNQVHSPPI